MKLLGKTPMALALNGLAKSLREALSGACEARRSYKALNGITMPSGSPGKSQEEGQEGQGSLKQLGRFPSSSFISPKVILAFFLALPWAPWKSSKLA